MDARHLETLGKLEAHRAESKEDLVAFREDIIREMNRAITEAVGRQELRFDARHEGLEAVLKEEMSGINSDLTLLFGVVTNTLRENQMKQDDIQSCLNGLRSLELRVRELEERPPAA